MATNISGATDEIYGTVRTAWTDKAPAVLDGAPYQILYYLLHGDKPPVDPTTKKPWDKPWLRVTIRHNTADRGSIGGQRYVNNGTVYVNIFLPWDYSAVGDKLLKLAQIVRDAFVANQRPGPRNVDFMRVRIQEGGQDGPYLSATVLADFTWDEFNAP